LFGYQCAYAVWMMGCLDAKIKMRLVNDNHFFPLATIIICQ